MRNGRGQRQAVLSASNAGSPEHGQRRQQAAALLESRKKLPIWSHLPEVKKHLRQKDILLLVGETGSGKSTQVPQCLIEESWCRSKTITVCSSSNGSQEVSVGGCIAITQPRRVAAISLARRVAAEMGTPLGNSSPASKVGYSVRFDNSTSPSTRIKYLTEGMLLQELLRDPWLLSYSAVIVDEIHERGINVDLVVGFLQRMLTGHFKGRGGVPLKVVVMSATADLAALQAFFMKGYDEVLRPDTSAEHRETGNSHAQNGTEAQDSESSWSGLSDSEDRASKTIEGQQALSNDRINVCTVRGRQYPVQVHYEREPVVDLIECALRKVFEIHFSEAMPGDILVFLTGQEDIESLEKLVNEYAMQLPTDVPKILVLPLFAALSQTDQQKVFQPASGGNTRRVILSTNIAETSVTVPGIKFVIDCGKAKMKQFRSRLGLDSLLAKPISKSSATQRKGRAGREAPGKCYRLYTESDYQKLVPSTQPEILRCDIAPAILVIKARGVDDLTNFPFLDLPPRESMEKALLQLYTLGALTETGQISELGRQMARLPLAPALSRVLLAAATPAMDCLSEAIDIISCLTVENIFLNVMSEEQKEQAEVARKGLLRREGDHLTLLNAVQQYAAEATDRRQWARRHFVSHRAMQAVMDVRKQLLTICRSLRLSGVSPVSLSSGPTSPERGATILRCFLAGFAANTARLSPDGSYRTVTNQHRIAIHPSSTLYGRKVEAIMYDEYVFTNKGYAKCVSAIQMDWIGEAFGVLS